MKLDGIFSFFKKKTSIDGLSNSTRPADSILATKSAWAESKSKLLDGDVSSLIGKGPIGRKGDDPVDLDGLKVRYLRVDNLGYGIVESDGLTGNELTQFSGANVKVPAGALLDAPWLEDGLGGELAVISLNNGDEGTLGLQIDLSTLPSGRPFLITSGLLSGCTMVYGINGNRLSAFHAGKNNTKGVWKTRSDGVSTLLNAHGIFEGGAKIEAVPNNNNLVSFLSDNYEHALVAYCARYDEAFISNMKANVHVLPYLENGTDSFGATAHVVLMRKGDEVSVEILADSLAATGTPLTFKSVGHVMCKETIHLGLSRWGSQGHSMLNS
ncbi:cytotoxic necrotizing factor Rho-activating domain-containing protein [Chromobacterium piscinae]|uniref:Cytotoxic necrotizing factor Rho-activating domain-containing protein n=1 Tax=Chromobacterium piscinae TaxID=686831 RepID=A0ABV0HBD3_9NEIS